MQKVAKQNGTAKKENVTVKKKVQKKLTEEAIGKSPASAKVKEAVKTDKVSVNLDDRIQKFEKQRGLATLGTP